MTKRGEKRQIYTQSCRSSKQFHVLFNPLFKVLFIFRSLYKLKKDRDESSRAVSEKCDVALAEIQARASAWLEDLQRRRTQRMLQCLTEIIDLTERREAIEVKMADTEVMFIIKRVSKVAIGYKGSDNP
ncbi:hypothetical protein GGI42DRAFT_89754 [Trichoderma sp. SZMC 28013]